jgi:hypothetical protein
VSYDQDNHRDTVHAWCLRLINEGGPGWFEYVTAKAKTLAKETPGVHGELPALVAQEIDRAKARLREGAPQ